MGSNRTSPRPSTSAQRGKTLLIDDFDAVTPTKPNVGTWLVLTALPPEAGRGAAAAGPRRGPGRTRRPRTEPAPRRSTRDRHPPCRRPDRPGDRSDGDDRGRAPPTGRRLRTHRGGLR